MKTIPPKNIEKEIFNLIEQITRKTNDEITVICHPDKLFEIHFESKGSWNSYSCIGLLSLWRKLNSIWNKLLDD